MKLKEISEKIRLKRYSVIVYDRNGKSVKDIRHCAGTLKKAYEKALLEMEPVEGSCAYIYIVKGGNAVMIRHIDNDRRLIKV